MQKINLKTYSDVSRWTLGGIMLIVCFAISAVIVLAISGSLQFVPFKENTAIALLAGFVGGLGLCALLLVLNIASNVSLMAAINLENHKAFQEGATQKSNFKKWLFLTVGLSFIGLVLTIGGTVLSKQQFQNIFTHQADEIVTNNRDLLEKISHHLVPLQGVENNATYESRRQIALALKILESQSDNIPSARIIWSKKLMGKTVFYDQDTYIYSGSDQDFVSDFYQCGEEKTCQWMKDFFEGKTNDAYSQSSFMKDDYSIYQPMDINGIKFILLLERRQNYGKIGSS